jgi:hypothetical protein
MFLAADAEFVALRVPTGLGTGCRAQERGDLFAGCGERIVPNHHA